MAYIRGVLDWTVDRSDDGHRTYSCDILVDLESEGVGYSLGPAAALQCPGLPLPGSFWAVGTDVDVYAKWRWGGRVRKHASGPDPTNLYVVTMSASTKAERQDNAGNSSGSGGGGQGNPLDVKDQISGSTVKYQEEDPSDEDGRELKTKVGELLRGPAVEWDKSRFNISYEQKRINVEGGLVLSLLDHLNDRPMWGFPARSVKLSSFGFDKMYYNDNYVYYSRKFEFEVRTRRNVGEIAAYYPDVGTGELIGDWDRLVREEGTMVWMGKWVTAGGTMEYQRSKILGVNIPVAVRYIDPHGQPARTLMKNGLPWVPDPLNPLDRADVVNDAPIRHYQEADLLGQLGLAIGI